METRYAIFGTNAGEYLTTEDDWGSIDDALTFDTVEKLLDCIQGYEDGLGFVAIHRLDAVSQLSFNSVVS